MRKKRTEPVSISSGFVLHENEYVLLSFHGDTKRAVSILNTDELIQSLEEIKKRKEMELPRLLRPYFEKIDMKNRAVLVFGSRGVGKTTFLLNRFRDRRMLYLSADNPLVATTDLWSIASTAFVRGYEGIIVDEAHYARDWSVHLKAIYDAYPTKLIIASDSSSLILRQGIADLSRRFSRVRIPLMSLREYIYLRDGALLPLLSPFALDSSVVKEIMGSTNVLAAFEEYLDRGFRPSYLEWDYKEQIEHIIEKTIHGDVPFFVPQISDIHFRLMSAVLGFLAISKVPTLNIERMCREWGIGKRKLYELLSVMDATGIIRIIFKENDNRTFSKGEKIFFGDPSFYSIGSKNTGTRREAYVAEAFEDAGSRVFACPDERNGDFLINETLVEVGGKNKKKKHADFVIRDDTDVPHLNCIPMWILGFQY